MTIKHITHVSIYVDDQDKALAWYTGKLGFVVRDDNSETIPRFRWLTVSPPENPSTKMVLFQSRSEEDRARIGKNPICVLGTDDCRGDYERLKDLGVEIVSPVEEVPWGLSAVFRDLYGNPYNLVEPKPMEA